MADDIALVEELRARIRELENKVEALRISRRVLMNLIDSIEREKREKVSRLEHLNERLQKNNCRYARTIMYRNIQILQLEEKLRSMLNKKTTESNFS
ncbi:MAG: translation initiation factor 2 [Negativicutes bacterium]|nr:translation initiation factor 2 [Negativicutes bacterium]